MQILPAYPAALTGGIDVKIFKRPTDGLKADGLPPTKFFIMPPVIKNDFSQRLDPENIHARFDVKMYACVFDQTGFTRIRQNQVNLALLGPFTDLHPDDRMGKCGMGTHQQDRFNRLIVLQKGGDAAVTQLSPQRGFRWCMSEPGAIIHMVVTDNGALKFLAQIDLFV